MKKVSIVILAIILLASCQNEKKTSLSFGQVVLTDEGMVLPVRKNPDFTGYYSLFNQDETQHFSMF